MYKSVLVNGLNFGKKLDIYLISFIELMSKFINQSYYVVNPFVTFRTA